MKLPHVAPPGRRFRTLTLGALPVVLCGGLLTLDHVPGTNIALTVPYAAEGPGPTVNTLGEVDGAAVVEVKAPRTYDTAGNLNMTTVAMRSRMTLTQALGRWLFTGDSLVPIDTVIPQGMSDEEVEESNKLAFAQSESAATIAAMDYLHIPVEVVVDGVVENSPAAGVLRKGDVIAAVDGRAVTKPAQARDAVQGSKPGETVTLSIERGGKKRSEKVVLASLPGDKDSAFLGVEMIAQPARDIDVEYNLQDIGGPSAGLMFTLAVVDKLTPENINGGKFVAGTGTIEADGSVGPIGGIEHKAVAAEEAGAELFLAPAANCPELAARKGGSMTIAKVEDLGDAIAAMDHFAHGQPVQTCQAG